MSERDAIAETRRLVRRAGFKIRLVAPELMDDCAALHQRTALGRKLGIPADEIWIARDLESVAPVLAYHEVVENLMRAEGVQPAASHVRAMTLERDLFEGTAIYRRAKKLLKSR